MDLILFVKSDKFMFAAQVEGWIMPEMPGVMTDILISMDDRLRLIRIGKKSGLGLAKKLVVTCMN